MIRPRRGTSWLELHPGAVPAGVMFDVAVSDAKDIARVRPSDPVDLRQPGGEFAVIGLLAHFEGFCKHHAAALISIYPELCRGLAAKRDLRLSPVDVHDHAEELATVFGSLVVQDVDFGTPKAIASFYRDLLGIALLSTADSDRLRSLIDDRNLIVHHGNILTPRYARHGFFPRDPARARMFTDSVDVTPAGALRAAGFLHTLSLKIRRATKRALAERLRKDRVRLSSTQREAVAALDWTESHGE